MEGTRPNAVDYEGHPAPAGPALTNDLCGQNVKIKIKTALILTLTLNILTALKGWVGHAPQGRGALHIYNYWHYCSRTHRTEYLSLLS